MGKRAVERRLRRQARKGGLKPRTMQKLMNKSIRMGPPPTPEPKTVMVKQGGKVDVEQYQDQVMRKFGGGQIKKQAGGKVFAGNWEKIGPARMADAAKDPQLMGSTGRRASGSRMKAGPGGYSKGGIIKAKVGRRVGKKPAAFKKQVGKKPNK
jgi:hypothetical protein